MATPDVGREETLYRQVLPPPRGNPIYFDAERSPSVHQSVFWPTQADLDGLSLIRSMYRSNEWSAYRQEKPDVRFLLAPMVADSCTQIANTAGLQDFGFAASEDSLDSQHGEPWAHCVATAINATNYSKANPATRAQIKEWAIGISDGIEREDVLGPFPEPDESIPYRPA